MRSSILSALKRTIRALATLKPTERLIRLISEEYAVAVANSGVRAARPLLESAIEPVVLRGPFAGLQYPGLNASGSALWPKLLGTYELELHDQIERLLAKKPNLVIDIGAAEGYYAVGIARRLQCATIIAFETDSRARQLLEKMVSVNEMQGTVHIRGHCTQSELNTTLKDGGRTSALLICDAETAEYGIFGEVSGVDLDSVDLIIELHACTSVPDPVEWMQRRFSATHVVTHIAAEPRITSAVRELRNLPYQVRSAVLFERTDHWGWVVCESRAKGISCDSPEKSGDMSAMGWSCS